MPSRFLQRVLSPHYKSNRVIGIDSLHHNISEQVDGTCLLPVEVLDEVVLFVLAENHVFSVVAAFSLASYQFRQIALRHFFQRLWATSKCSFQSACDIHGVYTWVRTLSSFSNVLFSHIDNIPRFSSLHSLEVDMSPEGLNTQHTFIRYLFKHVSSRLVHLKLSYIPRIDTTLLASISAKFPDLKTLRLTCTERLIDDCCWDCYEETASCTLHSPIPDVYSDAEDLSYAFGTALAPLSKLEHLDLGIFLSELDVFEFHLYNCHLITFQTIIGTARIENPACGGINTCEQCRELFAAPIRSTELFASASIARFLPSLKTVRWSTFFSEDNPGDDPDTLTTTVWVVRKTGKVRVRRAPWCS